MANKPVIPSVNDPQVIVRRARIADAEQMIQVHYDAVHSISNEIYSQALLDSWSPLPSLSRHEWMRNVIESDSRTVFIAELQDVICGFSICLTSKGLIYALYVDPKFAGRGIGKVALEHTENHLTQAGVSYSTLNSSLNAVKFYELMDYKIVSPSTQTLADGSEMDCYEMQKVL